MSGVAESLHGAGDTGAKHTSLLGRSRSDSVGVFVCISIVIIVFTFEAFVLMVSHEVKKYTDSQTLDYILEGPFSIWLVPGFLCASGGTRTSSSVLQQQL